MAKLRVLTNDGKNFNYELTRDRVSIGRSKSSDIVLPDLTASRSHASLSSTAEGYLIEDLSSYNGTFVNGSRITRQLLKHNDLVEIGNSSLTFLGEEEPASRKEETEVTAEEARGQTEEAVLKSVFLDEKQVEKELLFAIKPDKSKEESKVKSDIVAKDTSEICVLDLEKSNKILYVLYQISKKLNIVPDFDELLSTIMDLLFEVISADYGFVALLGKEPGELIPKVIKKGTESGTTSDQLKVSRTIIDKVIKEKVSILTSNAMDDSRFAGAKSIFLQNIRSAMSVPLWRKNEVVGIIQLDSFRMDNKFSKADLELLTTISNQMAMILEQANLNEQIRRAELMRSRLERFHSPEVVELIISGDIEDEETLMAPKEKSATVLFTDIIDFTPLSERLTPTETSVLLNLYFRQMTDIIFEYRGTLDKYIGDAIMAVFGAPIAREDDAERAVRAALAMRKALFEIMEKVEPDRRFDIRLGVNTGRVVAGNLGSPKRMDYTVIGDVVNTASRLESIAEPNQILIGEATHRLVKDAFNTRKIGRRLVKGKKQALTVYEVLD
jgi:adenylate cyclase